MSILYLVGVVHYDLKGPDRLKKILNYARPTAVGLESSQELIDMKVATHKEVAKITKKDQEQSDFFNKIISAVGEGKVKRRDNICLRFCYVDGFEFWTPYEYKKDKNFSLDIYPLHGHKMALNRENDLYKLADVKIVTKGGAFSKEIDGKLKKLGETGFQELMENVYHCIDDKTKDVPGLLEIIKNLDDSMEHKIRNLVKQNQDKGNIVIPVGCTHVYGTYGNNLFDRLKDLSPIRIKLSYVDHF